MIARVWRGSTRAEDADAYAAYLEETVFFPEDDRYLVEREPVVRHFEVDVNAEP
jgi:ketosteroid isomerase-like protein